MRLARVLGTIVSTIKHPVYVGHRILLCQPLAPDGQEMGGQMIALDSVDAGVGDHVLILTEGNGVRQILGQDGLPIRSLIVGVVDAVDLDEAALR
jgi:ethanolamine utilization protein EutN